MCLNKICVDTTTGKVYGFQTPYDLYTKCNGFDMQLTLPMPLVATLTKIAREN